MNNEALKGIRVLDFSQVWAGPYGSMLLAFMGAEVIKIEGNKRVDGSRLISLTTSQRFSGKDESLVFNELNMNKLTITLDMKQSKSVELAKELIKISDVVMQNFRPGVMDKFGLGYDVVREVKPDIIYLSSSAVGSTGPECKYGGYAPSFACLSGLASTVGYADAPPTTMGGRLDLISATTLAFSVVSALNHRQMTGKGQHIDLSSTETISVLLGDLLMDYTMNNRVRSRNGNRDEHMAPHNCYRCKGDDKWVSIAVGSEEEWKSFCSIIGKPDLAEDKRFENLGARKKNEDELDSLISEWTKNYTHYEVTEMMQKAGVAAFPSLSSEEIYKDAHLKDRDFSVDIKHPVIGDITVMSPPWHFSETPAQIKRHAPLFGEHNDYVFGELLGMSAEEIQGLKNEKVID